MVSDMCIRLLEKSYKKDKKYTVENRKLIGKMIDEEWMVPMNVLNSIIRMSV